MGKRLKFYILAGIAFVWQFLFQPIWNINVERWAESRDLDAKVDQASRTNWYDAMPGWLINSIDFLGGGFMYGVIFASALFLGLDLWRFGVNAKRQAFTDLHDDLDAAQKELWDAMFAGPSPHGAEQVGSYNYRVVLATKAIMPKLTKLGVRDPSYSEGDPLTYNIGYHAFFQTMAAFAKHGALEQAKKEAALMEAKLKGVDRWSQPLIGTGSETPR